MSYMPPNDPLSNSASMYVTDDLMWDPTAIKDFNFYADRAGNLTLNFTSPLTQSMMGESFLIQILNSSKNTVLHSIPTEFSTSFDYYVEAAGQYYVRIKSGGDIGSSAPGGTFTVETNFIASDKSNVNEGSAINFIIEAAGAAQGDILYYRLGGTISSADISTGSLIGTATVGTDGKANASILLQSDQITEGSETLTLTLQNSSRTITLASAAVVTINDTSTTPTLSVTANKTDVNEGAFVTYAITNAKPNTFFKFEISGISSQDLDRFNNALSDSFFVGDDGTASLSFKLDADSMTEGPENLELQIKNGSGATLATATPVIVNDTSKNPTYTITSNKISADEGEAVVFTLSTSDVKAGTMIKYSLDGISESDFSVSTAKYFRLNADGTATVTINIAADEIQEGDETLILKLEDSNGSELARSPSVSIRDTSSIPSFFLKRPIENLSFQEGGSSVNFGSGIEVAKGLYLFATVSISQGFQPGDVISIPIKNDETNSYDDETYSYNKDTGRLTLWFFPQTNALNSLFNDLVFYSTSDDPTNDGAANSRTFTWTLMGPAISKNISNTISIIGVNDAPTINTTQSIYKAVGVNPLHLENTGITIADPDSKALSLSLNSSDGKLKVSAGSSGATISQLNETSVVVSGSASQINSILEGAGDASITFDPFTLKNSKSEIKLIMSDGKLASEFVSLTIEKQLIQDIFPTSGNGGLFPTAIESLIANISEINKIFNSTNQSPITIAELNQLITQVAYVEQNVTSLIYSSGPNSAIQNHDTCNIIGSIVDQLGNIISNSII